MIIASCSTSKTVLPYFADISTTSEGIFPASDYLTKLKPDDELFISVTSTDQEATAMYNLPLNNPATKDIIGQYINPTVQTYVVDSEGNILFPELGKIHVTGMDIEQLQKLLSEKISAYVTDPLVRVELMNFNVNVAGEVTKPGQVQVKRNRFTILDALSAAGDLTPYGERSNILVIREENGERHYAHLNLNSSEILTSPYYYVKQNDYIYVEPNKIRQSNSKYNQDNAFKLSVVSTVVSAASVITSLVIALTVK
ncbi:MAG: polysaccharide biosynthesis/export family protein [Muribaculum sp.]|nr:polysaccharide biosynthesis/export family protein [Muribaculum sp.]